MQGIHCSSCHEKRKAYKKKRKQQRETRQNFKEITDLINNSFAETIVQVMAKRLYMLILIYIFI